MTEEIKKEIKGFCAAAAIYMAVCAYFTYVGMTCGTSAGCTVTFDSLEYGSMREAFLGLSTGCAFDIAAFMLIALAANSRLKGAITAAVLSIRSAAFGCAVSFVMANSVSAVAIAPMAAFCCVSLLVMLYSMVLKNVGADPLGRCILYLIVTGGAVMLKLLPMALV